MVYQEQVWVVYLVDHLLCCQQAGAGAPGIFGFGGIGNAIAAGKARFLPKSVANYIDADDVGLASQIAKKKNYHL